MRMSLGMKSIGENRIRKNRKRKVKYARTKESAEWQNRTQAGWDRGAARVTV